jgi:chromosome segregation ATPase
LNFNLGDRHISITREINKNVSFYSWDGSRVSKGTVLENFVNIGLDMSFPERFIILQHNTIQVATKKPKELLEHIEKLIGTHDLANQLQSIDDQMETCYKSKSDAFSKISKLEEEREGLKDKINDFEIFVDLEKEYQNESKDYHSKWIVFQTNELNLIKNSIKTQSDELEKLKLELEGSTTSLSDKQVVVTRILDEVTSLGEQYKQFEKSISELNMESERKKQLVEDNMEAIKSQKNAKMTLQKKITELHQEMDLCKKKCFDCQNILNQKPHTTLTETKEAEIILSLNQLRNNPQFLSLQQKFKHFQNHDEISELEKRFIGLKSEKSTLNSNSLSFQMELVQITTQIEKYKNLEKELESLRFDLCLLEKYSNSSQWHQKFLDAISFLSSDCSTIIGRGNRFPVVKSDR